MRPTVSVKHVPVLILLSLVCAAVNLTKPVHIDDSGHVDLARVALRDPLKVMTVDVNWGDTLLPVWTYGRPPLLFYLFALVMVVAGESLLALHGFIAILSAASVFLFHAIANRLVPEKATLLTALLFLGPAFLPGQNLMTDVPLMVLGLTVFWALLSATPERHHARYFVGSVAVAAACLVKYTSLALVPTFGLVVLIRRQWGCLGYLLVPIAALAGWSLFTYHAYGGIHLLHSPYMPLSVLKLFVWIIDWLAGLGSVAPFSVVFLSTRDAGRFGRYSLLLGLVGGAALYFASCTDPRVSHATGLTWAVFVANGLFVVGVFLRALWNDAARDWRQGDKLQLERKIILVVWLLGSCVFVIFFAPLMAIRHVLLAMPPLLLLLGPTWVRVAKCGWERLALGLTTFLGIALAVSDYAYADVYRQYAHRIAKELPPGARVWHTGHWGWQWYAERAGMLQYDTVRTVFRKGDYVVVPSIVAQQEIRPDHARAMTKVRTVIVPGRPLTWFRTMGDEPWGGYYAFSIHRQGPPWRLSRAPLETFDIYQVTDLAEDRNDPTVIR